MHTRLVIKFNDSADRDHVLRYIARAQSQGGTVGGVHAGLMCSALKRATVESPNSNARTAGEVITARTAAEAIREIGEGAGQVLATKALQILENLTRDEIKRFSCNGEMLYRLAKLLIVASQEEITWQYSAEAFKSELRTLKRIRRTRYV